MSSSLNWFIRADTGVLSLPPLSYSTENDLYGVAILKIGKIIWMNSYNSQEIAVRIKFWGEKHDGVILNPVNSNVIGYENFVAYRLNNGIEKFRKYLDHNENMKIEILEMPLKKPIGFSSMAFSNFLKRGLLPVFKEPIENYSSFEAANKVGALEIKFKCVFFPHPMAPGTEGAFLKTFNLFSTQTNFPSIPKDTLMGLQNQDHVEINAQYIKSEIERLRDTNYFQNSKNVDNEDFRKAGTKQISFGDTYKNDSNTLEIIVTFDRFKLEFQNMKKFANLEDLYFILSIKDLFENDRERSSKTEKEVIIGSIIFDFNGYLIGKNYDQNYYLPIHSNLAFNSENPFQTKIIDCKGFPLGYLYISFNLAQDKIKKTIPRPISVADKRKKSEQLVYLYLFIEKFENQLPNCSNISISHMFYGSKRKESQSSVKVIGDDPYILYDVIMPIVLDPLPYSVNPPLEIDFNSLINDKLIDIGKLSINMNGFSNLVYNNRTFGVKDFFLENELEFPLILYDCINPITSKNSDSHTISAAKIILAVGRPEQVNNLQESIRLDFEQTNFIDKTIGIQKSKYVKDAYFERTKTLHNFNLTSKQKTKRSSSKGKFNTSSPIWKDKGKNEEKIRKEISFLTYNEVFIKAFSKCYSNTKANPNIAIDFILTKEDINGKINGRDLFDFFKRFSPDLNNMYYPPLKHIFTLSMGSKFNSEYLVRSYKAFIYYQNKIIENLESWQDKLRTNYQKICSLVNQISPGYSYCAKIELSQRISSLVPEKISSRFLDLLVPNDQTVDKKSFLDIIHRDLRNFINIEFAEKEFIEEVKFKFINVLRDNNWIVENLNFGNQELDIFKIVDYLEKSGILVSLWEVLCLFCHLFIQKDRSYDLYCSAFKAQKYMNELYTESIATKKKWGK